MGQVTIILFYIFLMTILFFFYLFNSIFLCFPKNEWIKFVRKRTEGGQKSQNNVNANKGILPLREKTIMSLKYFCAPYLLMRLRGFFLLAVTNQARKHLCKSKGTSMSGWYNYSSVFVGHISQMPWIVDSISFCLFEICVIPSYTIIR